MIEIAFHDLRTSSPDLPFRAIVSRHGIDDAAFRVRHGKPDGSIAVLRRIPRRLVRGRAGLGHAVTLPDPALETLFTGARDLYSERGRCAKHSPDFQWTIRIDARIFRKRQQH